MYVHYQSHSIPGPLKVECSQGGITPKVGYRELWVGVHLAAPSCDLGCKGVEGKGGFGEVKVPTKWESLQHLWVSSWLLDTRLTSSPWWQSLPWDP